MFQFKFKTITHWATLSKLFYYILHIPWYIFSFLLTSAFTISQQWALCLLCMELVQHQITGKPWYFCWNYQSLEIRENFYSIIIFYSINFIGAATAFRSFIFLLHTSEAYTFKVATKGKECWYKYLAFQLPEALSENIFALKRNLLEKH